MLDRPPRDQSLDYHLAARSGIGCMQSRYMSVLNNNAPTPIISKCIYHAYNLRIDGFCENAAASRDVVHDLVQGGSLDLFAFEVGHGVHEVEAHTALPQFAYEQLLLL